VAGRDVERLHTDPGEPVLHGLGDELRAIVGADMSRWSTRDEQLGERCQNIFTPQPARDRQCQALPARLVDDRQDPELPAFMGAPLDEVAGPNMEIAAPERLKRIMCGELVRALDKHAPRSLRESARKAFAPPGTTWESYGGGTGQP
jgi:hypothetical protein